MQKLALFDFDGTVIRGDSILPFLRYCVDTKKASPMLIPKAIVDYIAFRLKISGVTSAKEHTLQFLQGQSAGELDALAHAFWSKHLNRLLFPAAVKRMQALRSLGYRVMLVSASASLYMHALADFLPVDDVICTECEMRDGIFTGRIGKNCSGEEKPKRILARLNELQIDMDAEGSVAFGNSSSDAPMLSMVDEAVWINPKASLRRAHPGMNVQHWRVRTHSSNK